jgi:glycosyltransferase involved in cell wall biosynthesis
MPAFLAILISLIKRDRIYWHKYAGSWDEPNPPRFYAFQRYLLKKAGNTHVTINGHWKKQEKHLLSFENPCLAEQEISWIEKHSAPRDFSGKLNFCFIGNIRAAKGMDFIVEAFSRMDLSRVDRVHFIGDGEARPEYQRKAESLDLPFVFHGFTLRSEMHAILNECHFLLLPSKSEGFPKVIAEVSPYGIIPVVTAISSIPQYVHHGENGFLVDKPTTDSLEETLNALLGTDAETLQDISRQASELHRKFTYSYYNKRIRRDILEEEDS